MEDKRLPAAKGFCKKSKLKITRGSYEKGKKAVGRQFPVYLPFSKIKL